MDARPLSGGLRDGRPASAREILDLALPLDLEITATTLSITAASGPDKKGTRSGRYLVRSVAGRVLTIATDAAGSGNEQMTFELTDADSLLFSIAGGGPGEPPLPLRRIARK